jgi:hypothetical protein
MAFDLFKKKKEVVDFRPRDSDMPIPAKMKERLMSTRPSSGIITTSSEPSSTTTSASSSGSGGFFSFFGGNSDSGSSSSPASEAKTDFWGNSTSSSDSSSSTTISSSSSYDKLESSLNDVIYRLSRLTDRFELVEKKLERVERKLGIGSENSY